MTKITESYAESSDRAVFICDFSPPRGADSGMLEPAKDLDVEFVSVAYNPGKSARVNSAMAAYWVKEHMGRDVVFTLATRDMNKVAAQSLLLGAQLLGLENVVVVRGDGFTEKDLTLMTEVGDYVPTSMLRSINEMNEGVDFKGLKLRVPTDFCVGASIDLGRGVEAEVALTRRKVEAGAQFFISQPTFQPGLPGEFLARYTEAFGEELAAPVFHGIQVMSPDSIVFSDVPQWVIDDLSKGRTGPDIALQVYRGFADAGFRSFYLVPPVLKGGRRDYGVAQQALEGFRA